MTERLENPAQEPFDYLTNLLPKHQAGHRIIPREQDQLVVCTPEFWTYGNSDFLRKRRFGRDAVLVIIGEKVDNAEMLTRRWCIGIPKEVKEWFQVTPEGVVGMASRRALKIETSIGGELVPVSTLDVGNPRREPIDLYIHDSNERVSLAYSLANNVRVALHELEIQTPQTP